MPMKLRSCVLHHDHPSTTILRLCDESGGGGALVPPVGGEDTDGLVVAGETVDTGLDENQTAKKVSYNCDCSIASLHVQLSVLVLAVGGEVLADGNSLLDEHVEVLWDLGGEA